jgi:flavin reductase (DIM6/NTAB) family NADH-FMN oxidoreductase RutF
MRAKHDFPVAKVRAFLEPGPIVLVSSAYKGETNIMTMGWHMILGESPSLVGCFIWDQNHSHEMIRKSRQCVINVPDVKLAKTVVKIGNCSGRSVDKFAKFGLTAVPALEVKAPLIAECHANFECKLVDARLIRKYGLFVFEVVKAHTLRSPRFPQTIHYRGEGEFMVAGATVATWRRLFKPSML